LPVAEVEAAVGLVSQDIFLFSGTIHDNILFGVDNVDGEKAQEAARVAQLLPAIESFSDQFQTVIGERGVRLSGGQKQRTALARAIIKNAPILILDDAFSSVDVETEEEILRELKRFMKGRTTLLISHRISTVRDADMIVYLRGGRIVELGTHDELVARRGTYYELYQRQKLARQVESMKHQKGKDRDSGISRRRGDPGLTTCPFDGADTALLAALLETAHGRLYLLLLHRNPVIGSLHYQDRHRSVILNHDIHGLDLMALAYLGAVLLGFVFLFIQTYTTEYTGQRAMHDLRMEIFSICKPRTWLTSTATGGAPHDSNRQRRRNAQRTFQHRWLGCWAICSLSSHAAVMLWLDWQLRSFVSRHFRRFTHQPILSPRARRSIGKAG
jgi:ABC-type multidrug transport system fused ATPase/permease subunit